MTVKELRERRNNLKKREDKVEKLLKKSKKDLKEFKDHLDEVQEDLEDTKKRKKEWKEALEEEAEADFVGAGEHPEKWESFVQNKLDEFADTIETYEAQCDRIIKKAADEEKFIKDLRKRDKKLDRRINRVLQQLIEAKEDKKGQLTKDFHIAEFHCRDGTKVPSDIVPAVKQLCILHLQPLRNSGGSVHINSGYRTRSYNAAIGGASASYHIYDLRMKAPAADHIQAGRSAGAVQQWHERSAHPFDGMGFYSGFTHGDDRGYRSRWYGAG